MNTYTNIEEAIAAFGLNFEVAKTPLYTKINGVEQQCDDNVATYRTDTEAQLGIVGSRYEIVQNLDQFGVFQTFADEGLVSFENGGVFGGGKRTYIQAVLPSTIDVNLDRGDITKKFITIVSSHDGSISLQAFVSPVRIVCTNTFQLAVKTGKHKTKIKHTKTANEKLEEAVKMIESALDVYKGYDEFIDASLHTKEFNDNEVKKFIEMLLPAAPTKKGKEISTRKENQRLDLIKTIHEGIGQDVIGEMNAYKLWNGVTTWTNNVLAEKKEDRFEFITFSNGSDINSTAYGILQNVVKNPLILA